MVSAIMVEHKRQMQSLYLQEAQKTITNKKQKQKTVMDTAVECQKQLISRERDNSSSSPLLYRAAVVVVITKLFTCNSSSNVVVLSLSTYQLNLTCSSRRNYAPYWDVKSAASARTLYLTL